MQFRSLHVEQFEISMCGAHTNLNNDQNGLVISYAFATHVFDPRYIEIHINCIIVRRHKLNSMEMNEISMASIDIFVWIINWAYWDNGLSIVNS